MHRVIRALALIVMIALAVAIYREWVMRNRPPLFLPLGFFESAEPVITPNTKLSQPATWNDPVEPVVMDDAGFDDVARSARDAEPVDVLVVGGTLGGTAALLAASHDGAKAMLVTDGEWYKDILTYAGLHLEESPSPVDSSQIEADIRGYLARMRGVARTERGLPSDVADYLRQQIDGLPEGTVLSEHAVVALARDASGRLHRALVRSSDGTDVVRIEFKTIIDGTKEGTLMALAGIETHSGWDVGTGEPGALPAQAIDAMSEGYMTNGGMVNGIGRRLDGVRAQMGIIDRGYHGTFLAPEALDDCWQADMKTASAMARQTVLRTKTIGCSAQFVFRSGFQDTVEVFFVNHGNERVSATIRMGSGAAFHVESVANPSDPFIRIGAFPINNSSPLRIDVRSSLPTDNLEGLIVRKLNTGMSTTLLTMGNGRESVYAAGPWTYTNNDLYVRTNAVDTPPTLVIDGEFFPTKMVGSGTYLAASIPMRHGERSIRIAENTIMNAILAVIPLSPAYTPLAVQRVTTTPSNDSWGVTPPHDGTVAVTLPRKACGTGCTFTMTDEQANIMLSGSIDSLTGRPASEALLGITDVVGGRAYTISIQSQEKGSYAPVVSYTDEAAGIYASGTTSAVLGVPTDGRMYDVWVHTPRSESAHVTMHGTAVDVQAQNSWTYAGTSISSFDDISMRAGGFVEMYAIPNTSLDVYNLTLPPEQSLSIEQEDLPSGTYDVSAYSETNPWTMSITNGETNTVQQVAFDEVGGYFVSQQPLIWHRDDSILISSSEWPLNITVYQSMAETSSAVLSEAVDKPQFTVLAGPSSIVGNDILSHASGSMLFAPMPNGIAPVTIGLLEHPQTDAYVRSTLDAAFARLRYAEVSDVCFGKNDPTCDARRYVRDPLIFNTNDSQSAHAVTVDGRRLVGIDTLSQSGAFAVRTSCEPKCNALCISGTIEKESCLEKQKHVTSPRDSIVAVHGINAAATIMSSKEEFVETLPSLLKALRRDGLLQAKKTYIEKMDAPRDFSLTLGMFIPRSEENFLVANTTASATHIASRALRSFSTELAIGSAVGHAAAFAEREEHSSPGAVARTPEAIARLQRYLIERGTMVFPTFDIENDHLLMESIQIRLLEGQASITPAWTNGRLTSKTNPTMGESVDVLRMQVFGDAPVTTAKQALSELSGIPQENVIDLLNYGVSRGFITQKMLLLDPRDIMGQQLNVDMLLKAEYLTSTSDKK